MFKENVSQMMGEVFKMHSEYVDIITLEKDELQLAYNEKTKKVDGGYDKYKTKALRVSLDIKKIKTAKKESMFDKEETFNIYTLSKNTKDEIKIENLIKIRDELFSIKSLETVEFTGSKIYIASLTKSLIDII